METSVASVTCNIRYRYDLLFPTAAGDFRDSLPEVRLVHHPHMDPDRLEY